ncbi:MAG: glycosyltransferase family 39 protein [Actinomycetota bacterium]
MVTAPRSVRLAASRIGGMRHIAAEQILVMSAQLASGLGNFAFAVIMARVLAPADFAVLRAFLALYLLINVPAGSMSAATALEPEVARTARRKVLYMGLGIALAMIVAATPISVLVEIPVPLIVLLAVSFPAISSRALLRGRLWGVGHHRRGAASLVLDVVVRLALGTGLGLIWGPVGAAIGVVAGGYASLLIVNDKGAVAAEPQGRRRAGAAWWTTTAFFLLAVILNQDLLLANKLLSTAQAAQFAGISTVGGIAAFATMAIPWLLLPREARGERGALSVALAITIALGGVALLASLIFPSEIVSVVLGDRYTEIAPLVAPYMLAMALFGVGRVLAAQRCAVGRARASVGILAVIAAVQAIGILVSAESAADVVMVSIAANAALCLAGILAYRSDAIVVPMRSAVKTVARRTSWVHAPILAAILAVAAGLRLSGVRGLWVDEAITVERARLGFAEMLETLRMTDVHPPLHYAVTWVVVRVFGRTESDVRLVSIAAGVLLVAVLYALGRELFDRRTALVAAAFGAVAPLLIWYSQEARMYSLLMLFSATAVWAQARALRQGSWWAWVLYPLVTAAMLWTHYFSVLQVVVQQLVFLVFIWKQRDTDRFGGLLSGWITTLLVIELLVAPLVPFAADQFAANNARHAGNLPTQTQTAASQAHDYVSIYTVLANVAWAVFGYHSDHLMSRLVALWPLGMVLAFLLLGRGRMSFNSRFVAAAAILPIAGLFVGGLMSRNVFEVRYFATAVPLLLLLGARLLIKVASRPAIFRVSIAAAVTLLLVAGADQQLNGTNPRIYDFRGAISEVDERSSPGDVFLYEPQFLASVIDYYAPGTGARSNTDALPRPVPGRRVFVLGSFLDKPGVAAQTGATLAQLENDYRLVDRFEEPQVRVWVFEAKARSAASREDETEGGSDG